MTGAARAFLLAALLAGVVLPAQSANVSIQIVNPDERIAIRVFLDRKLIYEGVPARSTLSNNPNLPAVVGPFAWDAVTRHVLVADIPSTSTKAQLQWTSRIDDSAWIVIHYYPGRSAPAEPAFFTFSLQGNSHTLR